MKKEISNVDSMSKVFSYNGFDYFIAVHSREFDPDEAFDFCLVITIGKIVGITINAEMTRYVTADDFLNTFNGSIINITEDTIKEFTENYRLNKDKI